jgi:hypothetical protein
LLIRIRIVLVSKVRIRIRVKSRNRIDIKVKILSYEGSKMEPWRALAAHSGGFQDQNGAVENLYASGQRFATLITLIRSKIRIRLKVTGRIRIRIRIKVMRNRHTAARYIIASVEILSFCNRTCSTTGKPTRSFATERVSLDSV